MGRERERLGARRRHSSSFFCSHAHRPPPRHTTHRPPSPAPPPPQIYIPKIPGVPDEIPFYPDRFGLDYEDVWLTAADGVKLHAWLLRPGGGGGMGGGAGPQSAHRAPRARGPLLIFFQENAGNMAMRLPFLRLLVRNLGCAVLAPR